MIFGPALIHPFSPYPKKKKQLKQSDPAEFFSILDTKSDFRLHYRHISVSSAIHSHEPIVG